MPNAGGNNVADAANRYRPLSVALLHFGVPSSPAATSCDTRSPALTSTPILSANNPTRFITNASLASALATLAWAQQPGANRLIADLLKKPDRPWARYEPALKSS